LTQSEEDVKKNSEEVKFKRIKVFNFEDNQPQIEITEMDPKGIIGLFKVNKIATFDQNEFAQNGSIELVMKINYANKHKLKNCVFEPAIYKMISLPIKSEVVVK
jgi:hypothetical protein